MASGTLVSRMLGLVRAALLAGVIGTTGYAADGFSAANSLPNTFYLLIAGGAVNAIFVPQIVRAKLRPDGDEFVNRIITISLAILAAATVVMVLLAPLAVRLYYNVDNAAALRPRDGVRRHLPAADLLLRALHDPRARCSTPTGASPATCGLRRWRTSSPSPGWSGSSGPGFPTSAAPADWTPQMIAILAGSATLSIVVQAVSLFVPLRRIGFRYRPVWGIRGQGLGEVSTVAKWTFGSIVVSSAGYVVTSQVLTRATKLGENGRRPGGGPRGVQPGPAHRHAAARPDHRLPHHCALHPAVRGGRPR